MGFVEGNKFLLGVCGILVAAGVLVAFFVPYKSTVMRCESDVVRLDSYFLGASRFYSREDGEWKRLVGDFPRVESDSPARGESIETTANSATRENVFRFYMGNQQKESILRLNLEDGEPYFFVITEIYDFFLRKKIYKDYHSTTDFEKKFLTYASSPDSCELISP